MGLPSSEKYNAKFNSIMQRVQSIIQRCFHLGKVNSVALSQSFVLVFPYYFGQDFQSCFDPASDKAFIIDSFAEKAQSCFEKRKKGLEVSPSPTLFFFFFLQLLSFRYAQQILSLPLEELLFQRYGVYSSEPGIRLTASGGCSADLRTGVFLFHLLSSCHWFFCLFLVGVVISVIPTNLRLQQSSVVQGFIFFF